jgi:hypothetical protein
VPHSKRHPPFRAGDAKHLLQSSLDIRKKHYAEGANRPVESVTLKRQLFACTLAKGDIGEASTPRFSSGGGDHLCNRIRADDRNQVTEFPSDCQGRFSSSAGHVQNKLVWLKTSVFNHGTSDRRKHPLNRLAVLLPIEGRLAPLSEDLV